MAAPLMKGLLNLLASKNSLEVAKSALPGAAINAVVGGIAAGPAGALPCLYLLALCFKQVVLIKEHFIIQA
jgi:hypothetical protein